MPTLCWVLKQGGEQGGSGIRAVCSLEGKRDNQLFKYQW